MFDFYFFEYDNPYDLEDFDGACDYNSLATFASGLGPSCGPCNIDLCTEESKAQIEKFSAMSFTDLKKVVEEKKEAIQAADDHFQSEVKKLFNLFFCTLTFDVFQ